MLRIFSTIVQASLKFLSGINNIPIIIKLSIPAIPPFIIRPLQLVPLIQAVEKYVIAAVNAITTVLAINPQAYFKPLSLKIFLKTFLIIQGILTKDIERIVASRIPYNPINLTKQRFKQTFTIPEISGRNLSSCHNLISNLFPSKVP